jgi:4-hydroxy-2-oxoheptanedioate aldolase
MELPQNSFKRALSAGRPQIGLWSSLSSSYSVEVIAGAGFDWILLDTEHSPADLENLLTQLQAAAPYPSHAVVRVPWNDMVTMKRVLDIGAQSLLVPYVSTDEEAKKAVSYTRYPPAGVRGVARSTRATRVGRV